ncbi:hypothetical protein JAAARDRAFT_203148 [Jaapia argillacea MUCL 33604]|uniref:LIM zinc-binding domain-containing protein n=1 Tax=Jaapia argillacea MUCL 33604 TaxID=933084 RepID=A0A067Q9V3_9AGAM|nr:hypothetical protein JAAARDRAFT_203148 [Jaapia argillacea MUCL 33604]
MGFCRRCGEIVNAARCKCGGTAVAPVVQWNAGNNREDNTDRWSRTYVKDTSPTRKVQTPAATPMAPQTTGPSTSSKRFPRPNSVAAPPETPLNPRVSAHIASTTASRPPSPLKQSSSSLNLTDSPSAAAAQGILQCPHTGELSKAYGSVLQPKESLSNFCCFICSTPFPPDATIYPDPNPSSPSSETRFLCRACFTTNGGSKGDCTACSRPVLILKTEGGFVENSGRVWHKRCFRCEGCFKNIGERPMVDLMGRPSCADCFDSCLKRPSPGSTNASPQRNQREGENQTPKKSNLGGTAGRKSIDGSPALDELEARLGIAKSREGTPAPTTTTTTTEDVGSRSRTLSTNSVKSPFSKDVDRERGYSPLTSRYAATMASRESSPTVDRLRGRTEGSPFNRFASPEREGRVSATSTGSPRYTGSPGGKVPTQDAIEEMKRRFLRSSISTPPPPGPAPVTTPASGPSTSPPPDPDKSPTPQRYTSRIPRPSGSLRASLSSSSLRGLREREKDAEGVLVLPDIPSLSMRDVAPPTPDLVSDFGFGSSEDGMGSSRRSSGPVTPPTSVSDCLGGGGGTGEEEDVFGAGNRIYTKALGRSLGGVGKAGIGKSQIPTPSSTQGTKRVSLPSTAPLTIPASNTTGTSSLPTSTTCARCHLQLFAGTGKGGKFVTVPEEPSVSGVPPKVYHADCFVCKVCGDGFPERGGRAVFIRCEMGACHVECAPPEKIITNYTGNTNVSNFTPPSESGSTSSRTYTANITTTPAVLKTQTTSHSDTSQTSARPQLNSISTSRGDRDVDFELPPKTAPPTTTSFPRWGSSTTCPGCFKSVSPMERGVVPGPQGSRWHASCLVCGGKDAKRRTFGFGEERKVGKEPGCGKKLDSAAKSDGEGGVWCRECLSLLPTSLREGSPTRTTPLIPTPTGNGASFWSNRGASTTAATTTPKGGIAPQYTGTTTIARQFTGLAGGGGGGESALLRQLTGGGLSPTRQLLGSSNVKQVPLNGSGGAGVRRFARPKSVIGMRSEGRLKSVDEGRGMFLVRQLTGGK